MLPDQELIGAYLDGELSGEDLARAETLLATQPECRQLLEELQALRTSLQALPQHTLGNDFANSVLRRAEREILQPAVTNVAQGYGRCTSTSGRHGYFGGAGSGPRPGRRLPRRQHS